MKFLSIGFTSYHLLCNVNFATRWVGVNRPWRIPFLLPVACTIAFKLLLLLASPPAYSTSSITEHQPCWLHLLTIAANKPSSRFFSFSYYTKSEQGEMGAHQSFWEITKFLFRSQWREVLGKISCALHWVREWYAWKKGEKSWNLKTWALLQSSLTSSTDSKSKSSNHP